MSDQEAAMTAEVEAEQSTDQPSSEQASAVQDQDTPPADADTSEPRAAESGATEPEATEPEATEPEATEPAGKSEPADESASEDTEPEDQGEPEEKEPEVVYDREGQLEQIRSGLLPHEKVIAVYDAIGAGTGFIGLTNRRVIIQDKSFVGGKVALTSIPYSKISAVSVFSNKSWAGSFFSSGSIMIHAGSMTHEVDFRGAHKSQHVHNVILYYLGH